MKRIHDEAIQLAGARRTFRMNMRQAVAPVSSTRARKSLSPPLSIVWPSRLFLRDGISPSGSSCSLSFCFFFSLWRCGKAARWIGLAKWVEEEEGLSEVRDSEPLLYGVCGRPRTGLLGLGVGETSLGGGNRFGEFWSCRERVERRLPRINRNCGVPAVPGPRPDSIPFGRKER